MYTYIMNRDKEGLIEVELEYNLRLSEGLNRPVELEVVNVTLLARDDG